MKSTFRHIVNGVDQSLRYAHLLNADVRGVKEHLWDCKPLIGEPQNLLPGLIFASKIHLLSRLQHKEKKMLYM